MDGRGDSRSGISEKLFVKYIYQVHLIDVESDPGQVAEKEQKSREPGKPSISIAKIESSKSK